MNTAVMFSHARDEWQTPLDLWTRLHVEFDFWIDAAATKDSALCATWFGPDHEDPAYRDALTASWCAALDRLGDTLNCGPAVYLNPPYSQSAAFIVKAAEEQRQGVTTVMLLPARTDTRVFHQHIYDADRWRARRGVELRFLRGRLRFQGASAGAPFPSMLAIFHGARRRRPA